MLSALALAALPASAAADKRFEGETAQGRTVILRTSDDDVLESLRINWKVKPCRNGGRVQDFTAFRPPSDAAEPEAFSVARAFTIAQDRGIRTRVRLSAEGRHVLAPARPAAERWRGTLKGTMVVRRRGRVIERCTLRRLSWSARLRQ